MGRLGLDPGTLGFAGPNVIEAFEGSKIPTDSQSAEANLLDRNIDVVLFDVAELVRYLGAVLSSTNLPDRHHRLNSETLPMIRNVSVTSQRRVFNFAPVGIHGPHFDLPKESPPHLPAPARLALARDESDALVEQYQDLMTDANRVDLEFVVQYGFTNAIAVYNYVQEAAYKRYPAIVGAFAKIGAQPFVTEGSQPSYQLLGESVIQRPSNPDQETSPPWRECWKWASGYTCPRYSSPTPWERNPRWRANDAASRER